MPKGFEFDLLAAAVILSSNSRKPPMKKSALYTIPTLLGLSQLHATTLLHFQVNSEDATTVAGGTVPGVDGSADGSVVGSVTLTDDIPLIRPAGGGDRALVFDGASGITLPGTQQLSNSVIASAGGFAMEAWISFAGGGNVNSIIDYAGTEKLVRNGTATGAGFLVNSAAPTYPLGDTTDASWHYVAAVFSTAADVGGDGSITGDLTFYFDSTTPVGTESGVTISTFGDSLNRTIGVGMHPVGFAGDFFNGAIYEPRVSTGALASNELLIGQAIPEPSSVILLIGGFGGLAWCRKRRRYYLNR